MRPRRLLWALLAGLLLAAPPLRAQPTGPVNVRSGQHRGFGRLVFDFHARVGWRIERHGDRVTLHFDSKRRIGAPKTLPHNVLALTGGEARAELRIVPGARLRQSRVGDRLVLDVLNPMRGPPVRPTRSSTEQPAKRPAADAATGSRAPRNATDAALTAATERASLPLPPAPPPLPAKSPEAEVPSVVRHRTDSAAAPPPSTPAVSSPPAQMAAVPAAQAGTSAPTGADTQVEPPAVVGPVALAAHRVAPPAGIRGATMLVPFEATVGAAAFPRGGDANIVFDTARPIDLSALRGDPIFGGARVHLLPAATLIRLKLPPDDVIALRRVLAGWEITVRPAPAPLHSIAERATHGRVHLTAAAPGQVVSVLDPGAGGPLLVATQRAAGEGMVVRHRAPGFVLLPTWQGVAVEALSDRLDLHAAPAGFELTGGGYPLAVTPSSAQTRALVAAAGLTRRFHIPTLPLQAAARRLRAQIATEATAPPLARGRLRRASARTMIALGMDREAMALLHLAAVDDAKEAGNPDHEGLAAIAALLAGEPRQAAGIDDPRLSGFDEVALWRAVRTAELQPGAPRAAAIFAATAPLVLTYPRAVRERLLPLAAETMIAAGDTRPAAALMARAGQDPSLTLARGMLAAAQGRTDTALAIYGKLAGGRDRLLRFRAATRAVALRLAKRLWTPAQAADALDRLRDAWIGGPRDLALREHLAELRAAAGQWQAAFATLRGTARDFPAHRDEIMARMRTMFAAMLHDKRVDGLSPLGFVALVNANADLIAQGAAGEAVEALLADRLLALDLPDQAAPLLARLMRTAATADGRAAFGARLAALRLRAGDPAAALAALSASAADGLPPALALRRAALQARAMAARGDAAGAVAALRGFDGADADAVRARILEDAHDWPGAERALHSWVARAVPPSGRLDDSARRLLLRLATATARAGDTKGLATLRATLGPRMGSGPLADMFRLLTAGAVHGLGDLGRSARETALAGRLTGDLRALR